MDYITLELAELYRTAKRQKTRLEPFASWRSALTGYATNFIFILFLILFTSGCSLKEQLKQNKTIENDFFSLTWNSASLSFAEDKQQSFVNVSKGSGYDSQNITIDIKYSTITANINIRSQPFEDNKNGGVFLPGSEMFFSRTSDYMMVNREGDGIPKMMTHNHYGERAYHLSWDKINFINEIKCLESVFLRQLSYREKVYKLYCGYYDLNQKKRVLFISYGYDRIADTSEWPAIIKSGKIPGLQPLEKHLKNAVEQLVRSLKLKNFDYPRMKKEGLLHSGMDYQISDI